MDQAQETRLDQVIADYQKFKPLPTDTLDWFLLLGVRPVQVLFDGVYDEVAIRRLYDARRDYDRCEGYVVRVAAAFPYGQFRQCVGKYVRADHVRTAHVGRRRLPEIEIIDLGEQEARAQALWSADHPMECWECWDRQDGRIRLRYRVRAMRAMRGKPDPFPRSTDA